MGPVLKSVWLITGASQGLGLALTLSALRAGHNVLAGARNPEKAAREHPEVESTGGKWIKLDVNSPEIVKVVADAVKETGRIDVVVNNAGYFLPGNLEDLQEDEMHAIMETNFFGPVRVLKGVLPMMRSQNSGTILLIGSVFGFYPCPAGTMYNCTKAAAAMLHETLKVELSSFNIRSLIVEAGLFQTGIMTNSIMPSNGFSDHYLQKTAIGELMGLMQTFIQNPQENIPGDPRKFGDRVVEFVDGTGIGEGLEENTRLLMGRDALDLAMKKMAILTEEYKACEKIAASAEFDGTSATGTSIIATL